MTKHINYHRFDSIKKVQRKAMLHWHQVWRYMYEVTGKEVEKRAVMELIANIEFQVNAIVKQSMIELQKLNELRRIQKICPKERIDEDCIRRAIKTLNTGAYPIMSERTGGNKEQNEKDTRSNEENKSSEVV